jgi:hypothetical protein
VHRFTAQAPALLAAGRAALLAIDGGEELVATVQRLLVVLGADMIALRRTMLAADRLMQVIRDQACGGKPTRYGPGAKIGTVRISAIAVNDVL